MLNHDAQRSLMVDVEVQPVPFAPQVRRAPDVGRFTPPGTPQSTQQILSAVGDAIACYDTRGTLLWSNPAFEELMTQRPGFADVERRLGKGAREVAARHGAPLADVEPSDYLQSGEFPAPAAGFSTRAVYIPATAPTERSMVVIILAKLSTRPYKRQLASWQQRYHLTPRELEVTEHLLRGLSNAEISESLGISPHTARHHTENVLDKLGVRSRAAIHALLRDD